MFRMICFAVLLLPGFAFADTKTEISSALDYFAEVWNQGDLDAIRGYYHPEFVLVTEQGAITVSQQLDDLEAIARSGKDSGVLEYTQGTVKELEDKHALAYGRFSLKFKDGSAIENWFTTVYEETPFGWKAILTHN